MKTKLLLGVFLAASLVANYLHSAQAEGFAYDVRTEVSISDDASTRVETEVSATAGDGASIPGTIDIPLIGTNPQNIRALDGEGNSLPTSTSDTAITLRLNALQAGGSDDFSINVLYTSTSGVSLGVSTLFMIPPFDYGGTAVASEEVTIRSSTELGNFVTRGTKPLESSADAGSFVNTWRENTGPLLSPVGLLFGDSSLAELGFQKTLQNDSYWWQTQSVVLPPDTNQQQVFLNNIEPAPSNVHLDVDGNVIVDYRIGPRQSVDVKASLQIAVNSYTYALDSTLLANDIDPVLIERYTDLNDAWIDTSLSFEGAQTTPVAELIETIYDRIAVEYASAQGANAYESAVSRSNSLIGELRANGIPSRLVVGAVFGDGANVFTAPQAHAWAEAYIPSVGWITLDPNFEQNGSYFGVADVQRIALALRGFDPEYPPENSVNFNITYPNTAPPAVPVMKPELAGTKHMILPGLSINTVSVQMPAGVIVDNAGVLVGSSDERQLGSLAPFQNVTLRSTSFLASAFTSESIQYGLLSSESLVDSDILAQGTMQVSYVPMLGLIAVLLLSFATYKFVWIRIQEKRNGKKEKKVKESRNKLTISKDAIGDEIENVDMLAALDVPEDGDVLSAPTNPMKQPAAVEKLAPVAAAKPMRPPAAIRSAERKPVTNTTQVAVLSPASDKARPAVAPQEAALRPQINLERAHEATPEEIRQEIAKKHPKNLIQ